VDLSEATEVSEQYLLDLERKAIRTPELCMQAEDELERLQSIMTRTRQYLPMQALLENLPNLESQTEKDRFEQLVFSSFNYEDSAQLDLEQFQLIGQLRQKSPYRVQANG
jgi:hypothetical protein